ncbi:MAG TPA: hypothetical protein VM266_06965 [Solirubrobacteraceae bacterium]|nr:hypothetical protein [Solirubrobacteraceae bacterium]
MSARQRLVFAAVAAAIAVVAAVALAGGGGDGGEEQAAAPTATATATPATTPGDAEATATATATPRPRPQIPTIEVAGGRVVRGVREISVRQGERVRFRVRSDVADHVHVHGYDVLRDVPAGGTVSFDFEATIPGIVEVELEEAGIELVSIRTTQ